MAIDIKSEVLGLAKRNVEKEYLNAKVSECKRTVKTDLMQRILFYSDTFSKIRISTFVKCCSWAGNSPVVK